MATNKGSFTFNAMKIASPEEVANIAARFAEAKISGVTKSLYDAGVRYAENANAQTLAAIENLKSAGVTIDGPGSNNATVRNDVARTNSPIISA